MTCCRKEGTTRPAGLRETCIWSEMLDSMIGHQVGIPYTFRLSQEEVVRIDPKIHAGDFGVNLQMSERYSIGFELTDEGCLEDASPFNSLGYGRKGLMASCVLPNARALGLECLTFKQRSRTYLFLSRRFVGVIIGMMIIGKLLNL